MPVTRTFGVQSARMWLTSGTARRNTTGTTTAPTAVIPPYA